jgi:hypothetical protein
LKIRILRIALPLAVALAAPVASDGGEWGGVRIDWFGDLSEEPSYFLLRRDTLANPRSNVLAFPEWQNRITADLNAAITAPPVKLVAKLRPTLDSQPTGADVSLPVDDLYLDLHLFQRAFVTVGVKNYREGVGLSLNPTDFLAEQKEQDFTRREEERKADREGNLVAAVDVFLRNVTLSAIVAPPVERLQEEEARGLLKVSALFEALKLDASALCFLADRPGAGLNLSKTAGEQLVLHAELAARWGSPRRQVQKTQEAVDALRPALFEIRDPPDQGKIFAELVAGGNYTFGNGTNVIGEYYFIQDGYSDRQWDHVLELMEVSRSQLLDEVFPDLARGNLLQANQLLTFRRLRRHYLFFRVHNAALVEKLDASLSFLLNLEDRSFAVAPILDFIGLKNLRLGINGTILEGGRDSEFGLSPFRARVSLLVRYSF